MTTLLIIYTIGVICSLALALLTAIVLERPKGKEWLIFYAVTCASWVGILMIIITLIRMASRKEDDNEIP